MYLNCLNIKFNDNSGEYIYDSYLPAKATKTYHQELQKRLEKLYQFVQISLVGRIDLISFLGKKDFITFNDDTTRITHTYT